MLDRALKERGGSPDELFRNTTVEPPQPRSAIGSFGRNRVATDLNGGGTPATQTGGNAGNGGGGIPLASAIPAPDDPFSNMSFEDRLLAENQAALAQEQAALRVAHLEGRFNPMAAEDSAKAAQLAAEQSAFYNFVAAPENMTAAYAQGFSPPPSPLDDLGPIYGPERPPKMPYKSINLNGMSAGDLPFNPELESRMVMNGLKSKSREGWLRSLLNTGEGTVGRRLAALEGKSLADIGLKGAGKLAWGAGEGLLAGQGVDMLGDYAIHLLNGGKPASRWENALKSAASFGVGGATMFGPEAAFITAPAGALYGYITGDDEGRARRATQQTIANADAQLSAYMDTQGVSPSGQKYVIDHVHGYIGKETDPAKIQDWYNKVSIPLADQTSKNESQVQQYLLPLMQQNTSNATNYASTYGTMALQNAQQVSDPSIRAALTAQANYYPARAASQAASQQNQLLSAIALGGATPQSVTDQYLNKILVSDQQNALKKQLAQQVSAGAAAGLSGSSASADPLSTQYAPASQGGYAG